MVSSNKGSANTLLGAQNTTLSVFNSCRVCVQNKGLADQLTKLQDKQRHTLSTLEMWYPASPLSSPCWSTGLKPLQEYTPQFVHTWSMTYPTRCSHLEYGIPHLVCQALAEALDLQQWGSHDALGFGNVVLQQPTGMEHGESGRFVFQSASRHKATNDPYPQVPIRKE